MSNESLIVLAFTVIGFLFGLCVGRFSQKQELTYLRNFKENRDRIDRICRT